MAPPMTKPALTSSPWLVILDDRNFSNEFCGGAGGLPKPKIMSGGGAARLRDVEVCQMAGTGRREGGVFCSLAAEASRATLASPPTHARGKLPRWKSGRGACGEVEGGAHGLVSSAGLRRSSKRWAVAGAMSSLQKRMIARTRLLILPGDNPCITQRGADGCAMSKTHENSLAVASVPSLA